MTGKQQLGVVAAILVIAAVAVFSIQHFLGDEISPVSIGKEAPDFTAYTVIDDEPTVKTLKDYEGEVVLLNIWATWCGPCREEMPSMQRLYEEYGPKGLHVVAVSIDDEGMGPAVLEFGRDFGLSFELLHDPQGTIQRSYQTTGVPESMLIGKDGIIRTKVAGAVNWDSENYRNIIQRLLAE